MDWQILTTFFSFCSLMVGILVLMAQTHIKRAQNAQAETLIQLLASCTSTLSIVREMDKQQDLFVRQMPPHVEPMDTQDAPEGYKWLTVQSQEDVKERFKEVAQKAIEDFNCKLSYYKSPIEPATIPLTGPVYCKGNKGKKRGPYKKKTKPTTKID